MLPLTRLLRPLVLVVLALAVAVTAIAGAQSRAPAVKLPGGGRVTVELPPPKPKKGKKRKAKRSNPRTHVVQVGVADQKARMFGDARFTRLGITTVRRSVAWDFHLYDWQVSEIDEWLRRARAAGVRPLIAFARSRLASQIHAIPTRQQWLDGFREFRRRWGWVTDFVASNESNHTDPTAKRPELAAGYYKDMRRACRTCRVVAATFNEREKSRRKRDRLWLRRFIKAAGHQPKYWALHNYYGANTFNLSGTRWFLRQVKGQVWITEVGGIVIRRSGNFAGKLKMPEGLSHSTRVWRFIFDRMLPLSPRITKVYLYHWDSATPADSWDSALIGFDGRARIGLNIVRTRLTRRR